MFASDCCPNLAVRVLGSRVLPWTTDADVVGVPLPASCSDTSIEPPRTER